MHHSIEQYRQLLGTYLRPQRGRVSLLALLLLAGIALQLVNPQLLRYFIDSAQAGAARAALIAAGAAFVGMALATQGLSVAATYLSEQVGWEATNALRADLALHLLRLDLAFHKARTPGELIERVDGDVTAMANFFSQFVIKVLGNALLAVGVLAMLFREDWRVGLALSAFALLVLLVLVGTQRVAVPYWKRARQASAELFGFIEERLSGTEDIRSSGAVPYTMRRLAEHMRGQMRVERTANVIGAVTWATPVGLFAIGVGVAFVLIKRLFDGGALSLGSAYLIFFYTQALFQPLDLITRQIEDFQKAAAGFARVRELLAVRGSLRDGDTPLPAGPLAVDFETVSFGYADEAASGPQQTSAGVPAGAYQPPAEIERVVHEVSFSLAPGRVLGILGRTGSGKTTLTRLLFRLYDPQAGAVRLGGLDIRDASRAGLRARVGMVTQDVQLFHASVRDNLTFFDETIGDAELLAALGELGLRPWLDALPQRLDTILASGGGLSAGEAQLLAFTRVFLRDPGLVILDEASARLDPATEQLLERALDRLLRPAQGRRTGIIIAHRLGTVLRADDILILEGGRVAEFGPREQLMRDPGSRFAALLRVGMHEVLA